MKYEYHLSDYLNNAMVTVHSSIAVELMVKKENTSQRYPLMVHSCPVKTKGAYDLYNVEPFRWTGQAIIILNLFLQGGIFHWKKVTYCYYNLLNYQSYGKTQVGGFFFFFEQFATLVTFFIHMRKKKTTENIPSHPSHTIITFPSLPFPIISLVYTYIRQLLVLEFQT